MSAHDVATEHDQHVVDDVAPGTGLRGGPALRLLASNALDATSRNVLDLAVDATAVLLVGASALQIGLLNAAGTVAFLLLGVPIGVLVDRRDARTTMAVALASRGLVLGVLAWMLSAGQVSFLLLAAVSLLVGISGAVTETGQTVHATEAVPAPLVGRLVSRLQAADSVLSLVAPAAAGLALGVVGAPGLVLAAAVIAFLAAVALVVGQAAPRPSPVPATRDEPTPAPSVPAAEVRGLRRFVADVGAGIAPFRSDPLLRRLTWSTALLNLGLAAYSAVSAILELRVLELGPQAFGALVGVGAAGGLLGSVVAEPLARRLSRARIVVASRVALVAVAVAPLLALHVHRAGIGASGGGGVPVVPLALMGLHAFTWGLFVVIGDIQVYTLVAERVPAEVLGRVVALRRTLTFGAVPVGSILGGLLGEAAGVEGVLVLSVVVTAAAAVLLSRASRD